jgi:hypothetical protein
MPLLTHCEPPEASACPSATLFRISLLGLLLRFCGRLVPTLTLFPLLCTFFCIPSLCFTCGSGSCDRKWLHSFYMMLTACLTTAVGSWTSAVTLCQCLPQEASVAFITTVFWPVWPAAVLLEERKCDVFHILLLVGEFCIRVRIIRIRDVSPFMDWLNSTSVLLLKCDWGRLTTCRCSRL